MKHNYPSTEQVERASREELARWYRFLPSPGASAIGRDDFEKVAEEETRIMNQIIERFKSLGGMTPKISKKIGWQ